jgi:hypothetical protein
MPTISSIIIWLVMMCYYYSSFNLILKLLLEHLHLSLPFAGLFGLVDAGQCRPLGRHGQVGRDHGPTSHEGHGPGRGIVVVGCHHNFQSSYLNILSDHWHTNSLTDLISVFTEHWTLRTSDGGKSLHLRNTYRDGCSDDAERSAPTKCEMRLLGYLCYIRVLYRVPHISSCDGGQSKPF